MKPHRIYFVNTFEPVVPLYRHVFIRLKEGGGEPIAIVSSCQYRVDGVQDAFDRKPMWVPRILRENRRWCAVFYCFMASFQLLRIPSACRIVFLSQPPLFYIAGALIARRRAIPYSLHVMDLYPELLFQHGLSGGRWLRNWMDSLSKMVFLGAENIIVPGRCMKAILCDKGVPPDKLTVIENWAEKDLHADAEAGERFRKTHGLSGKFVVMYSGNMGHFHNFRTILAVAKRMRVHRDLVFVFVGQGVRRREIQEEIDRGAANIMLFECQPLHELNAVLNAADVHFVSLQEGFEGLMVPSKFYGILAVGRPVIYEGNARGEVARVIAEEGCGKVIRSGDVQALERSLVEYLSAGDRTVAQGTRARQAYETRFHPDAQSVRYAQAVGA